MWVAELRIWKEKSVGVRATERYDVEAQSYYLNVFRKNGKDYVNKAMVIKGPDRNAYIEFLRAQPKFHVYASEGDKVFYSHESMDALNAQVADENVFFVKPITGKGGFEYWTIASWSKSDIAAFIKKVGKMKGVKVRILGLRQKDVDIFLSSALNRLTKKQLGALKKAVSEGYYDFPRKKDIKNLAQEEGVDESTLREHLRKAESEIMKAALEQLFAP